MSNVKSQKSKVRSKEYVVMNGKVPPLYEVERGQGGEFVRITEGQGVR